MSFAHRVAALMSQNHVTMYFCKAKQHRVQWQLNRSYSLTCTPGHVAAQFNQHGNCATVTVDTVVLGKFHDAGVSKITAELTTFLPCSLTNKTECNRGYHSCFAACNVKCSCSIGKERGFQTMGGFQTLLWKRKKGRRIQKPPLTLLVLCPHPFLVADSCTWQRLYQRIGSTAHTWLALVLRLPRPHSLHIRPLPSLLLTQKEVQNIELPEVLIVNGVVGKVGLVGPHL